MKRFSRLMLFWIISLGVSLAALAATSEAVSAMNMSEEVSFIGKEQLYSDAQVWNIWCDQSDQCTVNGVPVDFKSYIKDMPIASWGWCRKEFCYGNKDLSDVIGLNPKYFTE